ncbi:hypothetical protein Tco_0716868 [Tanacetum coccineum]
MDSIGQADPLKVTDVRRGYPLEALGNEAHIFENAFAARLDALRNHIDEQGTPRHNDNVNEPLMKEGVNLEHGDENIIDEAHGDNAGGLSDCVLSRVLLINHVRRHPGSLERATRDKGIVVTAKSE